MPSFDYNTIVHTEIKQTINLLTEDYVIKTPSCYRFLRTDKRISTFVFLLLCAGNANIVTTLARHGQSQPLVIRLYANRNECNGGSMQAEGLVRLLHLVLLKTAIFIDQTETTFPVTSIRLSWKRTKWYRPQWIHWGYLSVVTSLLPWLSFGADCNLLP